MLASWCAAAHQITARSRIGFAQDSGSETCTVCRLVGLEPGDPATNKWRRTKQLPCYSWQISAVAADSGIGFQVQFRHL